MAELNVIQIYSQFQQHDDAWIVATREALIELKAAIDEALDHGIGAIDPAWCADGEGYELNVVCVPEDGFKPLLPPYTAEHAIGDTAGLTHPAMAFFLRKASKEQP